MPEGIRKILRRKGGAAPGRTSPQPDQGAPGEEGRRRFRDSARWLEDGTGPAPPIRPLADGAGAEGLRRTLNTLNHEIRAPLAALVSSLDLILRQDAGPVTPDQARFLGIARRNVERLQRLTTDMLDAAGADAGRLAVRPIRVDLGPLLRESIQLQAAAAADRGLDFDATGLPGTFRAEIDPDRLLQVVDNLVGNALKFTEPPGLVRIWLERRLRAPSPTAALLAERCGLPLELFGLVIEDSGRGIPADRLPGLFRPFNRVTGAQDPAVPGSGLGLHITRGIVRAMQGSLNLASRPGRGTTVWVRLPRDTASARLLAAGDALQEWLAEAGSQGRLAVLDLRWRRQPVADEAVLGFLESAAGSGSGLALERGLWAAAVADPREWERRWAESGQPADWDFLPGVGPGPGNCQGPPEKADHSARETILSRI